MLDLVSVEAGVDSSHLSAGISCRRISYAQWWRGEAHAADVVVWNNNLILPAGAREKMLRTKLLVNWGTGDSNIRHRQEWSGVRLVTTSGYCTQAVRDFVLGCVARYAPVGPSSVVGLIGMGRIGYATALAVRPHVDRVLYHARRPRPGLPFESRCAEDVLSAADVIVVVANTRDPLDLTGLHNNRRRPFVITVSPDEVLPVAAVAELISRGSVRGIVSDNPTPSDRPDLARFYTGKVAYRSAPSRSHKHSILAKELLTVRAGSEADPMIYIARHGRTEWNDNARRQGRLDSPITPGGIEQAHQLARLARERGVRCVYSSPLPRAAHTAAIAAEELGTEARIVDSFVEMDFGALQGELVCAEAAFPSFVAAREVDRLHTSYPQGGESYLDVSLRVQPDVDHIAGLGVTSLIVGHGSVNRMMRPFLVDGLTLDAAAQHRQPHNVVLGVNLVTRTETRFTLGGE
jgi:broad specificity phosphatase PhoE